MTIAAPRLSICIPSFNRGAFIGETLESIVSQITPDVEVVVSDNASTDDTGAVVESFRDRIPRLVFSRNETNVGFSRNFMRAVDLSAGEYCCLMGSDDVLCDGMLPRAMERLTTGDCVYIYDRIEWDSVSGMRRLDAVLDPGFRGDQFALGNRDVRLAYLGASRTIAAMFSFISSIVFRRADWQRVAMQPHWYDCAFPHAMRLFAMFDRDATLRYVREPFVLSRLGNDTFNPGGSRTIKRLLMDYDGFRMIIDEYWRSDAAVASAAKTVMRRTHPAIDVLKFRRIVRDDELPALVDSLGYFEYGRAFSAAYATNTCRAAIVGLKKLYQRLGLSQ